MHEFLIVWPLLFSYRRQYSRGQITVNKSSMGHGSWIQMHADTFFNALMNTFKRFPLLGKHLRDVAHHQSNKDLQEQFTILKKCRGKLEIWNFFRPTKETSTQHCLTQLKQNYFVLSHHFLYSTIFRVLSASYLSNRPQNLLPTECYRVQVDKPAGCYRKEHLAL